MIYHSDGTVTLRDYARKPVRITFRVWLRSTDIAIYVVERAIPRGVKDDSEATDAEIFAKRWLAAFFSYASKSSVTVANYKA